MSSSSRSSDELIPPKRIIVLFTNVTREKMKELTPMLEQLGGTITQNASECSHLVSDGMARTIKFMAAINICDYVLTTDWITDSYQANKWLSESKYELHDDRIENEYGFILNDTMKKRKTMKQKLFQDLQFYITPNTKPTPKDLEYIIVIAGGTVVPAANGKCIVISCMEDEDIFKSCIQKYPSLETKIYATEFIMTAVLVQEMDQNSNRLPEE